MSNDTEGKVWNGRKGVWEDDTVKEIPRWNQQTGRSEYSNGESYDERNLRLAEENRQASITRGFDLRSEVSEDARYISGRIVKHLWIIFVLLPGVLGILSAIVINLMK